MCERNNSINTKVSAEAKGEGASGARTEILLQPMVRRAVHLQPMGGHMSDQGDAQRSHYGAGSCTPWSSVSWPS